MSANPNITSQPDSSRKLVAVIDDHTMMRSGMKTFLESLPDFECCWTAGDCKEALSLMEKTLPDVLIVDITLPDRNGLEFVKDIHPVYPKLPILVISMHDESFYAHRALKAGAKGYMMKNVSYDIYEKALRRVASGGTWLSEVVSEQIFEAYTSGTRQKSDGDLATLSDREFEVFQMIGDGGSTHAIADALRLSSKTVDVHRMNIRIKLKLEDGSAVTRYAIRWVESRKHGLP